MKITWQQRMTNKRVVEMAGINEISCEVRRRRWNWLGHVLRRERETTVLQHWGGLQKDEERERDQRPLGEELLRGREREGRQGGRVGM